MNPTICRAIAGRFVIEFDYDGAHRVVEPHTHGLSTAGNEVLRGYQVSGQSTSGSVPDWKLFTVPKMSGLFVKAETFAHTRPLFDPNDDAMVEVHCHV